MVLHVLNVLVLSQYVYFEADLNIKTEPVEEGIKIKTIIQRMGFERTNFQESGRGRIPTFNGIIDADLYLDYRNYLPRILIYY